jgi:hypothetical protein
MTFASGIPDRTFVCSPLPLSPSTFAIDELSTVHHRLTHNCLQVMISFIQPLALVTETGRLRSLSRVVYILTTNDLCPHANDASLRRFEPAFTARTVPKQSSSRKWVLGGVISRANPGQSW